MRSQIGNNIWPIPVMALVAAAGAFAVMVSLGVFDAQPVEAVKGNNLGQPFGVELTDTLMSLDLEADGDLDDPGDVPIVSGYTFTVRSDAAFTTTTTLTVTFPDGVDLTAVDTAAANYKFYNPATGVEGFVATAGPVDPPVGQVLTIPAPDGFSISAGSNITVRILEGANIRNPSTSFCRPHIAAGADCANGLKLKVKSSSDATEATSKQFSVGSRISFAPSDPGDLSEVRITFWAPNDVIAEDGKVIITFEDDFSSAGFPSTIDKSHIKIKADRIKNGADIFTTSVTGSGPRPNQVVNPSADPSIDIIGASTNEPQVKFTVPDMDPAETSTNSGSQDLAKNALVTVTFSIGAGIHLPTEAATAHQIENFHSHSMVVRTTDAQGVDDSSRDFRTEFHLPRVIELDTDANAVGGTVSVVGKGFKNGKQVTVFLDVNGDGVLQTEESILATTTVEGNDTFSTSFVVDSRFTGNSSDDRINAVDGEGNSVCSYSYGSAGLCNQSGITGEALDEFFLDPVVLVDPSSGAPGSEFNITLRDFPANDAVTSVILGGVEVLSPTGSKLTGTTDAQGGLTLRAEVPNLPTEGVHRLSVFTAGSDFDTNFTVTSANLGLIPGQAVPNQALTFNVSGFTIGGSAVVCEDKITIAGDPVTLTNDSRDGTGGLCPAGVGFVNITSSGTFAATAPIPVTSSTLDAGRDGNSLVVKIIDSEGRLATASLQITQSVLSVTPEQSEPFSTVVVKGSNFPADNIDGAPQFSAQVTIKYVHDKGTRTTSVLPDASGNFRATVIVPSNTAIPSDNTIEAQITGTDGAVSTITTIHRVSGGVTTIEPSAAIPGAFVKISGQGFRLFTSVEAIEFSGRDILGWGTVATNERGDFEIDNLVVPDLDPGIHNVVVRVGAGDEEVSASTTFEIQGRGFTGPTMNPIEALSPLGPSLVRVFYFENFNKTWTFFDPRLEFAEANDLLEFITGQVYWLLVDSSQTVTLNGRERNLTCISDDCWNQIVW